MKVSSRLLVSKGACLGQVKLFCKLFGAKSVEITEALCLKHADKFDWDWAANNLLSALAQQEYERATAPARQKYNHVMALARQKYNRVMASAFAKASA